MSTTWDPMQYAKFSDHRSRPFVDLLARVGAVAPAWSWTWAAATGR